MIKESASRSEAASLLRQAGLPDESLTRAAGVANDVWMSTSAVVRLNTGRFRNAFHYEARVLEHLSPDVPHPAVLDVGYRESGGEYLILERLPGRTLSDEWPALSPDEQEQVICNLVRVTKSLHQHTFERDLENPWIADAVNGNYRNAYHAPPAIYRELVASAIVRRSEEEFFLRSVERFIAERASAFGHETDVHVHADLHFRNVIVERSTITGLIDFEGSRRAPADVELDTIIRSLRFHKEFGTAASIDPEDIVRWFRYGYPEIFAHVRLLERLEVYEAMWHLVQIHHWTPGGYSSDPIAALGNLLTGVFSRDVQAML